MSEKELEQAYDEAAEKYLYSRTIGEENTGFQNREMEQPLMFELVPKDLHGKKLLDLGCGPGIHVKEYVNRGAESIGIDLSKEMIKLAKQHCPQARFEKGNINELDLENGSFDIITSSLAFDHIKDLEGVIAKIKDLLKAKGLFIFSVPHPIKQMFRNSDRGTFIPSNDYFDNEIIYYNIAESEAKFPGYPRTLQEYFQKLLKQSFKLIDFRENQPKESWKERGLLFTKIPCICFFVWEKEV
jgi:SAM-dependent methyltransferase